jgi:aminoglycoside phosphotransferase (APT) family kinase protein
MSDTLQQSALTGDDLPDEIRAATGPILHLSGIPQGDTSDVALVESTQGTFVVKRAVHQPFRDWLRCEYSVLRALAATGLPIPRVYTYVERTTATGGCYWLLMEHLPGQPLHAILQSERRAGVRHDLLAAFGHLLAQVHRCPPPPELVTSDQPWLDGMLQRAGQYLQCYPVDGTPALLAQLERRRPPPVPATLIHGDYMLDNVLVVQQAITGLVDWAGGAVGDPRYDLALATQPRTVAFQTPEDVDAFYAGYGGPRLRAAEARYFLGLYEFF